MTSRVLLDPATEQPVGALVDATSVETPKAVVLEGRFGRVEKLDPSRHATDLWQALSADNKCS